MTDRLRGLEIDDQLAVGPLLHGNVGGLGAPQHFDEQPGCVKFVGRS